MMDNVLLTVVVRSRVTIVAIIPSAIAFLFVRQFSLAGALVSASILAIVGYQIEKKWLRDNSLTTFWTKLWFLGLVLGFAACLEVARAYDRDVAIASMGIWYCAAFAYQYVQLYAVTFGDS